ncbi:MAG: metal-dependent phosphohydrolase, partial [Ilumatobacteraceae bacterium]
MSADEHELRAAWSGCIDDSRDARVLFDSLIGRHREAHRRYHGVRHVTWVVRHVHQLAASEPVDDLAGVVVAAFFHDAIYD